MSYISHFHPVLFLPSFPNILSFHVRYLTFVICIFQNNILRHHNEELCGSECLAKIAYDHQICTENDV